MAERPINPLTTKFNRATRRAGDRFRTTGSEEAWREFARLRRTARRVRESQSFAQALVVVGEWWPTPSKTTRKHCAPYWRVEPRRWKIRVVAPVAFMFGGSVVVPR